MPSGHNINCINATNIPWQMSVTYTKWKSKTRVTSYDLKSTSCEFKSTNFEFQSTSYEFKSTSLCTSCWSQVFLRQGCIWLVKLKKVEDSVRVEFSELSSHGRVIKIGDFYWLGIVLVACKKWTTSGKNSLLFKMSLNPFYLVSGRPLFLPGMGHIAFSTSKASCKNVIMTKFGRLKGRDKKFQIP